MKAVAGFMPTVEKVVSRGNQVIALRLAANLA
jgi:hypothetical protein